MQFRQMFYRKVLYKSLLKIQLTLKAFKVSPISKRHISDNFRLEIKKRVKDNKFSHRNMDKTAESKKTLRQVVNGVDLVRRVKYKDKKDSLPPPGTIDLRVISSGGRGTPKSVLLNTTNESYLFNCGENTYRISCSSRLDKFSKTENIFITHKSWDNIGGLHGMALSLEAAGVPKVTLHGPTGIETVTRDAIFFAEGCRIIIGRQQPWMTTYSDDNINVTYVPLLPEEKEQFHNPSKNISSSYNSNENTNSNTVCQDSSITSEGTSISSTEPSSPPTKKKKLSVFMPLTDPDCTYAYIIKPHPRPRSVDLSRCKSLGLKPGPLIGKLKNEESVTLPDETVIHPDQVLMPKENPKPILVVECPSEDYLYSLLRSEKLSECQGDNDNSAELVVHMSSYNMVNNQQYQQFIQRFSSSTRHMFLHEKTSTLSLPSVLELQSTLNLLNSTIFPQLHIPKQQIEDFKSENHILAKPFMKYSYRPKKIVSFEDCLPEDFECKTRDQFASDSNIMKTVTDYKELVSSKQSTSEDKGSDFPEVVFLGTASSVPGAFRNCTSILLHMDEETNLLMDCGEGSLSQLLMLYGDKTDEVLIKLKAIFISHLHADHHLGMSGLVFERKAALARAGMEITPILLIAPVQIISWLRTNEEQFRVNSLKEVLQLVYSQNLMREPYTVPIKNEKDPSLLEVVKSKLNCTDFLPVPVLHSKHACGLVITHKSGWKIVYSGDTMPCKALIETGKDCDLLIHEATLQSDMVADAAKKRHSTVKQAIEVGIQMQAKFQMLTHFSQRYKRIPLVEHKEFHNKFGLAYDFMKVKLSDAEVLNDMIDPLTEIFKEDIEYSRKKEADTKKKSKHISKRLGNLSEVLKAV
ncbi:zinc phosphodiesterase ELAC protein 2-like [Mytilus trossulus]|uniref:zinc phosphodiesterase ELAC protein 2-like n=1 Tax=Mytilus trossulus TaxID=6551 RepID=UPI003004B678